MSTDKYEARDGPNTELARLEASPEFRAGREAGARAALEHPPSQEMLEDVARVLYAAERSSGRRD